MIIAKKSPRFLDSFYHLSSRFILYLSNKTTVYTIFIPSPFWYRFFFSTKKKVTFGVWDNVTHITSPSPGSRLPPPRSRCRFNRIGGYLELGWWFSITWIGSSIGTSICWNTRMAQVLRPGWLVGWLGKVGKPGVYFFVYEWVMLILQDL